MNHQNTNTKILGPTADQGSSGDDEDADKKIDIDKGLPKHQFGTVAGAADGKGIEMSQNIQFGKFNTG